MSNHYHLLIETPSGNLSQIMRHINGAYTTYFNIKRKRAGHLFQGRYKAILVEADEYATELSRYIHLNPVRAGMVTKPEDYQWSSYRYFIGQSKTPEWMKTDFLLGYFGGNTVEPQNKYRQFVEELLETKYDSPLKTVVASTILGSQDFVNKVVKKKQGLQNDERNVPAAKALRQQLSIDAIIAKVREELGDEKNTKNMIIYCCRKYSGAKLKDIGERFGMSDSAVSQTCRRLLVKADRDPRINEMIHRLEATLRAVNG